MVDTPNNATVGVKVTDTGTDTVYNAGSIQFGGARVSNPGQGQALVQPTLVVTVPYKAAIPGAAVYTAPTGGAIVLGVNGFITTADGGAGTLQPVIVNPGTTVTSGATLTTNTFASNGTVSQNQSLTLIAAPTLAAGQSIGLTSTGTISTGVGVLTFHIQEPVG